MAAWFWYFVLYSFCGFILELLFARVTRSAKQDRKCLYFLPLCPVYGLGAVLILALSAPVRASAPLLILFGGAAATAAEYLLGGFYHAVAGVDFWDYSHLPFHIKGRVCLLFSAIWGVLALVLVRTIHPAVAALVSRIPSWTAVPAATFLFMDALLSLYVLRREKSTDALRWYLRLGAFRKRAEE